MKDIALPPQPNLEIRDLRLVLALASAGTTAKAASMLHVTQPAVSRALLAAEERLEARLFERTPRGLVPTECGARMLEGARRVLLELGELERGARARPVLKKIRLVCECYTAYHWLPSALLGMRRTLPDLRVSLAVEHTTEPVEALAAGKIDAALITTAPLPRGPLAERPLFADEVVFLVAPSHPLARQKALSRADLGRYPLLTSKAAPDEVKWFMSSTFGRARPRLRFEIIPLTEAIVDMTRAGMGVAILSEWVAQPHLDRGDLLVKRLASGPLHRPWRLAWRRELGETALRLHEALTACVPEARRAG